MKTVDTFFAGVISGIVTLGFALIAIGLTPKAELQRIRNEAVSAGVAEWVVSYDSNGSPVLEFRWKQSKQVF